MIRTGEIQGWASVSIENAALAVTVLPGKGADIYALVDVASGVDLLFKAPWGLQPAGAPPREGSGGMPFLENYEGGWQELFPNTNDPCRHAGRDLPFHGEVATVAWAWERQDEPGGGQALVLTVECPVSPFRLRRTMRLRGESAVLELEETVTNLGDARERFTWGHHCVLGPPLVARGARLSAPARTVRTVAELWEDTARLEPGQRSAWPRARLRGGGEVDLSALPGPEAGSHDDVYLDDLEAGWVAVENAELGLGFRLDWDLDVFRAIISWQPFGGAHAMPLAGAYALGVEPWVGLGNLEALSAAGAALELPPGGSLTTTLTASVLHV